MNEKEFENRYAFDEKKDHIGSGGFSNVFRAKDTIHGNDVAIKKSPVNPTWGGFTLQREVEIVNRLRPIHNNIARYESCYRFKNIAGSTDFAILKFYELGNLDQFLIHNSLTIKEKDAIIRGILSGVAFLHQKNIIHRDLKASNILIAREKDVLVPKITDFGQAREAAREALMENSAIAMSYHYAAPEQIDNTKILMNVDLWSVGILIYRIMTGVLPFRSDAPETTQSMIQKIRNVDLPKPLYDLPEPYKTLVIKCLVKDVTQRVQKAEDLLKVMDDYTKKLDKESETEKEIRLKQEEERIRLNQEKERIRLNQEKERTRLMQEEKERTRLKQEEEERTRLKQEEEERTRLKQEEERTRLKQEEERTRLKQEKEEQTRLKQEEEERTRLKQEEERTRLKQEEERIRLKQEEEERARLQQKVVKTSKFAPFLPEMDKEVKSWVGVTLAVMIICGILGYCSVPKLPQKVSEVIPPKESPPSLPPTAPLPTDNFPIVRQQIIEQLCNAGIKNKFNVNITVNPNGSVDSMHIIYNCLNCDERNKTLIKTTSARLKLDTPISNGNPIVYKSNFDSDSIKCKQ
jgi:serine/threonine protein kinase